MSYGMNTNLMLVLSAVIVITSGVSLAVFMNSSGQDHITNSYPKPELALDIEDDTIQDSDTSENPADTG